MVSDAGAAGNKLPNVSDPCPNLNPSPGLLAPKVKGATDPSADFGVPKKPALKEDVPAVDTVTPAIDDVVVVVAAELPRNENVEEAGCMAPNVKGFALLASADSVEAAALDGAKEKVDKVATAVEAAGAEETEPNENLTLVLNAGGASDFTVFDSNATVLKVSQI